jgi:hypothetical protein
MASSKPMFVKFAHFLGLIIVSEKNKENYFGNSKNK